MSKGDSLSSTAQKTLHVFGTFSEPSHITIGDTYTADKHILSDSRYKGKQMLTHPLKKGRTDTTLLEKGYKPLFASDQYVEMESLQRKQHLEEMKKANPKPFIPANPPKKSVGKGSLYGTIQPPPEHKPEGIREVTKGSTKFESRNFQTSPPKKGGYGYYHTTIGGKEFEYLTDPYGGVKKKVVGQLEAKPITTPFRSTIHGDRLFDQKVYTEDRHVQRSQSAPKKEKPITVPFKSMSPMGATIAKFPPYIAVDDKLTAEERIKRIKHESTWKPSGTSDLSTPSKSIALTGLAERQTFLRSRRLPS